MEWCRRQQWNLEAAVDALIDLCQQYDVKMTCFVLGQLGRENPGVVRKLHRTGHEIASHGYSHQLVYMMTPDAFKADVRTSCAVLEDITGERVIGFRAPSYSVNETILDWYYGTLEEAGLKYSSSIYPVKTFLYGIDGFPEKAHYPEVNGRRYSILEFPAPVVNIVGRKVGLYIRLFPAWFINSYMKKRNEEGKMTFIYVHPRELDRNQPRLKLPFLLSLIHYYGIKDCEKKIEDIFRSSNARFLRMGDVVRKDVQI